MTNLTRRDYFAALALQGLIAADRALTDSGMAEAAVNYADELIVSLDTNATNDEPQANSQFSVEAFHLELARELFLHSLSATLAFDKADEFMAEAERRGHVTKGKPE